MKNCLFGFLMLFTVMASQAQNDTIKRNNFGKNEIKINSFFLLLGVFEPSYERNLSEQSSVGVSAFIPFDRENIDMDINYYISPYYRIFFGEKYAAGFFLEGFGMLNSIDHQYYVNRNNYTEIKDNAVTDFALGFGLGGKWMTSGGFVFEVNGGIGRNLFNTNTEDDNNILVGKFGFNLGYRF
ncbi:hypothetical protein LX77_03735 [Gelidibacter algens]|uniref:DUF3575 domain-containing protein n=1 Tax=Gelidibacter algens TaxID=49280 RepID=A0A1A7QYM8_9FLAO|nr:DUF3575 domain-containing protein [Gelidibacter algens]OBX23632.1 hypothetical protein A9996_15825 [Gelidibacter algens]RAJ18700.1 hypothetical protein LX77_03735 [Gelidibacter algens]